MKTFEVYNMKDLLRLNNPEPVKVFQSIDANSAKHLFFDKFSNEDACLFFGEHLIADTKR